MKENLLHLIQKYSEGKINLKELIELSDLIADKGNPDTELILHDDWQKQLKSEMIPVRDLNPILDKVHHHIRLNEAIETAKINWIQYFQRVAAILILPLLIAFATYFYFQNKQASIPATYADIQCPLGARIKFELPDGSKGFLNSGSHLKYPVRFTDGRKVELIGEAFFNVVHIHKQPFHVITPNLDIKVLGTCFDVIANDDENTEEVILERGKVKIFSKDGKHLGFLKPNEKLTLNTKTLTLRKEEVEASQYSTWKVGKLEFRNENMEQVARRLSRWYNAEVIVKDHLLDNYTFHATFIDEPLDEVLKLLALTTPMNFREQKRSSDENGVFQKRKIMLGVNKSKINKFK